MSTVLAENIGRKKSPQKSPSRHHPTTLSGYIFATKARIDNRKKNFLSTNMSSTRPSQYGQYGELRPTGGEIDPVVWGASANFNGFRRALAALLHGI